MSLYDCFQAEEKKEEPGNVVLACGRSEMKQKDGWRDRVSKQNEDVESE